VIGMSRQGTRGVSADRFCEILYEQLIGDLPLTSDAQVKARESITAMIHDADQPPYLRQPGGWEKLFVLATRRDREIRELFATAALRAAYDARAAEWRCRQDAVAQQHTKAGE
jgi:hypothetical protein